MKKTKFSVYFVFFLLIGCDASENALDPIPLEPLAITTSEKVALQIPSDVGVCTYVSDNNMIALVTSSGMVQAKIAGTTTIKIRNAQNTYLATCEVTVSPTHFMFKEPILDFGSDKTSIKAKESRVLLSDVGEDVVYSGENRYLRNLVYTFSGASLFKAECVVSTSYTDLLASFINERYIYLGELKDMLIFVSPDYKDVVCAYMFARDSYWKMVYLKNASKTKNEVRINFIVGINYRSDDIVRLIKHGANSHPVLIKEL